MRGSARSNSGRSIEQPFLPRHVDEEMVKSWRPSNLHITLLQHCHHAHSRLCRRLPGLMASRARSRAGSVSDVLCSLPVAPKFTFAEKSCQGCARHINISSSYIMQIVCNSEMLKQLKTFEFCAKRTVCITFTDCSVSYFN